MFFVYVCCLYLLNFTWADDKIIHVIPGCPTSYNGRPRPQVRADVPAHATAKCRNGKKTFTTSNEVKYTLEATLNQKYIGDDCMYFKKNGSNTFHINVEIGWGEEGSTVHKQEEIYTITCAYDEHGDALTSFETIGHPFIAPQEKQSLKGQAHTSAVFKLEVVDVRGEKMESDHIHIGRLIRLKATDTSGTVTAFRALSCFALNPVTSYAILRAGCGDGLILPKTEGFLTEENVVYSPFFEAFKLRGADTVKFECNFTVCTTSCDGDSCKSESKRKRRSADIGDHGHPEDNHNLVMADTGYMWAKAPDHKPNDLPSVDIGNPPVQKTPTTVKGPEESVQVGNSPKPDCPKYLDQQLSPEAEYTIVAVLAVFGSLLLFNFLICIYLCCKVEISHLELRKK